MAAVLIALAAMTLFIGGVPVGFWQISKYIWRIAAILLAVMAQFIGDVSVGFWQIIGIHMAHSNIMVGDEQHVLG